MDHAADILLALSLGVALAAAAGLRVFVPLLGVALAAWLGRLELAPAFQWLATLPAVLTFAVAAAVEIAAYYVPGVDHLLDLVMTPLALVAGVVLVLVPLADLPPLVRWTVALVGGGGAAGLTQLASTLLRAKSGAATGGLGNPLVSTGELGGSVLLSGLALLLPLVALLLAGVLVAAVVVLARKRLRRESA